MLLCVRGGAQVWGFVSVVCTVGMRVKTGGEEEHDLEHLLWLGGHHHVDSFSASNVGRISLGDMLREMV